MLLAVRELYKQNVDKLIVVYVDYDKIVRSNVRLHMHCGAV